MKNTALSLIFSCIAALSFAQSCPNIGFEDSTLIGWEGDTGTWNTTTTNLSPGLGGLRHVIKYDKNEFDPWSDSNLRVVAPGSEYSLKLGYGINQGGGRIQQISYELNVDSINSLLVYGVAIVLNDGGHPQIQQPKFEVTVLDTAGNLLDSVCGKISYTADTAISGFQTSSLVNGGEAVLYRDWEFAGIDLANYIGQDVIINFESRSCPFSAHFGYAYIDASCFPRDIQVDYCLGQSDTITFKAPFGFDYLWSTGDTTQSFKVLADSSDTLYTCTLTSTLTGCSFVLDARPDPTFYSNFSIAEKSCGEATITPTLDINRGSIAGYFWNFGDSTTLADTATSSQPSYTYPGPGKYEVTVIANDGNGCFSDTLRDSVNIYFPPQASFTFDTACFGDTTIFTNLSDVSFNVISNFLWDFGDSSAIDTNFNPSYVYKDDTTFNVTLIVWSDSLQCGDTLEQTILVNPRPIVDFYKIEPDSCIPHEVHFVNTSTFKDSSSIINYTWNFGNDSLSNVLNPVFVYNQPGIFSPKLIAIDTFGCIDSLQLTDLIRVAEIPEAIFNADSVEVHISNPVIGFNNLSAAADGYIWTFGDSTNIGVGTSDENEPIWKFSSAGIYNVELLAYSIYGCYDTATLTIKVIDDRLSLSNVITPNGDGVNDVFYFNGNRTSLSNFSCQIFNRWGSLIYETSYPSFNWDGTVNGELVAPGTYFYVIDYVGFKSKPFSYRGEITVLH